MSAAADLVAATAESLLGCPYVYGAWGENCTPAGRRKRVRSDHPTIVSGCPVLSGKRKDCQGCAWAGKPMFDCRGFTHYCLAAAGMDISGGGATSQYRAGKNWAERGEISRMPDLVCCLFRYDRATGRMAHTGLHLGGGRVIHCSHGVEEGALTGWTHYALPKGLYTAEEIRQARRLFMTILRKGSRGAAVTALQQGLNQLGYACGQADGAFGAQTQAAVRAFQSAQGLTADGIAGEATQAALAVALEAAESAGADLLRRMEVLEARVSALEEAAHE